MRIFLQGYLYAVTQHLLTRWNFLFLNSLKGFRDLLQRSHNIDNFIHFIDNSNHLKNLIIRIRWFRDVLLKSSGKVPRSLSDPMTFRHHLVNMIIGKSLVKTNQRTISALIAFFVRIAFFHSTSCNAFI